MEKILGTVRARWFGAQRFRWIAVAVAWGICALGWGLIWLLPNVYQAHAKLYVDTESMLRPLLSGIAVNSDAMSQLKLMQVFLMSRPNLERVARETGLAARAPSSGEFDKLVNRLPASITIAGGRDQTFLLEYTDTDRQMAHRVVEALLGSFLQAGAGAKLDDSTGAQNFLSAQIKEYETRLRAAEAALADFRRANVGLMPGEGGDYYTRLQGELKRLEEIQSRLRLANERRTELSRQIEGEEPTVGMLATGLISPSTPVDAKLAELRRKMELLLVSVTEKHPEVVSIREQIAQLEERKRTARSRGELMSVDGLGDGGQTGTTLAVNPVYQSMKIALSQAEVEVSDLRTMLSEQQRVVATLRSRVNTMPNVEAQLAQLTRDYEVNRAQYTALLQRLESARISQDAQQANNGLKFRVVEAPRLPKYPAGPNRPVLMLLILMFALGTGAGIALALDLSRPGISDRAQLVAVTGYTALGSVMRCQTGGHLPFLRRPVVRFSAAIAALFISFIGLSVYARVLAQRLVS